MNSNNSNKKHIYFTGFMASGKSRVGRCLAERLNVQFIDTDTLIAENAGKSISEIFAEDGETVFRQMEKDLIQSLAKDSTPKVISLGGGALSQECIVEAIRNSGTLIRLWASPEVLSERIARKNTRPLMAGLSDEERLAKIKTMLKERECWYSKADFSVESSNDYPEYVVAEKIIQILKFWKSYALSVETSSGERYPIFIGKNLLSHLGCLLETTGLIKTHKFLVCTDTTVAKAQSRTLDKIRRQASDCPVFKFRAGEINKTLSSLNQLYSYMLHREFGRKSCLLQFSGGVVGDMAGFGAATYQRGIPFIQLPTTLLSMVDSSVGGKVAVNHPAGKNMIGAFYQPKAVVCDLGALATLAENEIQAGIAEIVKYGVIYDLDFFAYMESHIEQIKEKNEEVLKKLIHRSCSIKAEVVGIDEKENGLRAILNYGHTFGHAIEKLSNYKTYSHGIAVSLGMRVAARAAVLLGIFSEAEEKRQNDLLNALGLPEKACFEIDVNAAWQAMGVDKKAEKNNRVYILPTCIGHVEKISNIPEYIVRNAWNVIQKEQV